MEAIGLAASCAGLLTLIATISTKTYQTVHTFRDARQDMEGVERELSSLKFCLSSLQTDANAPEFRCPANIRSHLLSVLQDCRTVLEQMGNLLDSTVAISTRQAIKWTLVRQTEINHLRDRLEAHKQTLDIALQMINLSVTSAIKQDTTEIREDTTRILNEIHVLLARFTSPGVALDGPNLALQSFLAESVVYAESIAGDVEHLSDHAGHEYGNDMPTHERYVSPPYQETHMHPLQFDQGYQSRLIPSPQVNGDERSHAPSGAVGDGQVEMSPVRLDSHFMRELWTATESGDNRLVSKFAQSTSTSSSLNIFGYARDHDISHAHPGVGQAYLTSYVTAVELAAYNASAATVNLLADKGAVINSTQLGLAPLYFGSPLAALLQGPSFGTPAFNETLGVLLDRGANPDVLSINGESILYYLIVNNAGLDCVKKMLDARAGPNFRSAEQHPSPHAGTTNSNTNTYTNTNTNTNTSTNTSTSTSICSRRPLPCAIAHLRPKSRPKMIDLLLTYAADLNGYCPLHGNALFLTIEPKTTHCNREFMRTLLERGAHVNVQIDHPDTGGRTTPWALARAYRRPRGASGLPYLVYRRVMYQEIMTILKDYGARE